ncbi:hypothetical protein GC170_07475 [bacterium]|nr:hypothetical protein [bacterium]
MTLSANLTPVDASAPPPTVSGTDRSGFANFEPPRIPAGADAPPLQRRIQANRDNARKSTGPRTSEGKARSRNNAIRHGLTSRLALPAETVHEIADHFWRLVQAYRPVDAVTVNAILELTICSWKFRRLFEQYASNQARARLTVNDDRKAREIRLAQRWFRKLSEDPRKALAHLRRTTSGLSLIVESFENLIAELNQPEGSWTSRQFMLAVNLGGFDDFEVWDNVALRSIWSAWFACRPGRKAVPEDFHAIELAYPEYRNRAKKAIESAPLAAEGRRQLIEWVRSLRDEAVRRLEIQDQVEDDLDSIHPLAAGWPAPEETSQHMLYLRYSNQVDRKTRELHALIGTRAVVASGDSWKFDEELLPSDWKAVLVEHRAIKSVVAGHHKSEMPESMGEILMPADSCEPVDSNFHRNHEKSNDSHAEDESSPQNRHELFQSIAPQPTADSEMRASGTTSSNAIMKPGMKDQSPDSFVDPVMPSENQASEVREMPVSVDPIRKNPFETLNETQASIRPESVPVSGNRARTPAPPRSNHRRLRPDKPTDIRRERHRHTVTKPARPPEKRSS